VFGHHVRGPTAERFVLPTRLRFAVDGIAVAAEADEAHGLRLQPRDEPLDARCAFAVLVAGQLVGAWRGPLHEVGHAHAINPQRVAWIVGLRDDARVERGGPEAVAGARVIRGRLRRSTRSD